MIGGQYLDITGGDADLAELHRLKTGRLFAASVGLGLWAAEVPEAEQAPWRAFGEELGLLFQVVDDVLDGDGYAARLGCRRGARARRTRQASGRTRALGRDRGRHVGACARSSTASSLAPRSVGDRRQPVTRVHAPSRTIAPGGKLVRSRALERPACGLRPREERCRVAAARIGDERRSTGRDNGTPSKRDERLRRCAPRRGRPQRGRDRIGRVSGVAGAPVEHGRRRRRARWPRRSRRRGRGLGRPVRREHVGRRRAAQRSDGRASPQPSSSTRLPSRSSVATCCASAIPLGQSSAQYGRNSSSSKRVLVDQALGIGGAREHELAIPPSTMRSSRIRLACQRR